MKLSTQQREQIRASIVRELKAARYGLTEGLLLPLIQSSGFAGLELDQLREELEWLETEGILRVSRNRFSKANPMWCLKGDNE